MRDQAVDRAEREAVDQLLQKIGHLPPLPAALRDTAQLMRKLARDRKAGLRRRMPMPAGHRRW